MTPLAKDLQTPKHSLDDFSSVAERVLAYLPNIVSEKRDANAYTMPFLTLGRPFRANVIRKTDYRAMPSSLHTSFEGCFLILILGFSKNSN